MAGNEFNERRIREIAMNEVSAQIKPLHDWMLSFWSNGSGRPPGFFQMRVKADDERYERLAAEQRKTVESLETVTDFVRTFNTRQKEQEDRQKEKEKRLAFWWPIAKWVLGGIVAAGLGLGSWAITRIEPVLKILWEDYIKAHPVVMEKMKNLSYHEVEQLYSEDNKPTEISGSDWISE